MVAPKFQNYWTLGNIIQIATFIITAVIFGVTMGAQVKTNTEAIKDATALRGGIEVRLRTVETNNARAEERLTSIYALLSRIDSRLERIEEKR